MKTFPAGFTAQKNTISGTRPLWILKITAGGSAYYLSDMAVTIPTWNGGVTTRAWVEKWGRVYEQVSGDYSELRISDFDVDCVNDPAATPNLGSLVDSAPEDWPAELYLWFRDCNAATDPPQLMWKGYVVDPENPDEATVTLRMQDESVRLQDAYIGTKLSAQDWYYPGDTPISTTLASAVNSGEISTALSSPLRKPAVPAGVTLTASCGSSDAVLTVSATTKMGQNTALKIGTELVLVNWVISATQINVSRGISSTVAAAHTAGDAVTEVLGVIGSSVTAASTSLAVLPGGYSGGAGYQLAKGMVLQIDTEQMYVSSVSFSDILTTAVVTRGYNGTTAASHSAGAFLTLVTPAADNTLTVPDGSLWWAGITATITGANGSEDITVTGVAGNLLTVTRNKTFGYTTSRPGDLWRAFGTGDSIVTNNRGQYGFQVASAAGLNSMMVLQVGTERMRIETVAGTTLTVTRGWGGTTLAAHAIGDAVSVVYESPSAPGYPNTDPDDVGKVIPIIYGTVKAVECLAVDAGTITTLSAAVDDTLATWPVSSTVGISTGKVFTIDEETVSVTAVDATASTVTVTRGYASTDAAPHLRGASLVEQKTTPFAFLVADHPVDSIDRVYTKVNGQVVDVTGDCQIFTGNPGSSNPKYPGKAVLQLTNLPAITQKVNLSVSQGSHQHGSASPTLMTVPLDAAVNVSGAANPWSSLHPASYVVDGDDNTYGGNAGGYGAYGDFRRNAAVSAGSNPTRMRVWLKAGSATYIGHGTVYINGVAVAEFEQASTPGGNICLTPWLTVKAWTDITASNTYVHFLTGGYMSKVFSIWYEVDYSTSGTYSEATGVTLSGNSVVNTLIGDTLYADVTHNCYTPADVFTDLLGRCSTLPLQVVGAFPASYRLDGVITEYATALSWLTKLAFQCRAFFCVSRGTAYLIFRDTLASAKTISACRERGGLKVLSRKRVPRERVVNTINLLFGRDWTLQGGQATSYTGISKGKDTTSVSRYGVRERPDLFMLDFVGPGNQAMADDLRAYYLTACSVRPWRYELEVFLEHIEVEFPDGVTLGVASGSPLGRVVEAGISPGSATEPDVISLAVEV